MLFIDVVKATDLTAAESVQMQKKKKIYKTLILYDNW